MLLRTTLLLIAVAAVQAQPYCLLRKSPVGAGPNCFEFYLADTAKVGPALLAIPTTPVCTLTPYASRQGWVNDAMFPGPLPTWQAGDLAMHAVSPYHKDAYGCRTGGSTTPGTGSTTGGTGSGVGGYVCPTPDGCRVQQVINQPETRDATGRLTAEAARIQVLSCPAGVTYIYQYMNRPGFRVIRPPNWASPVGGMDFGTCDQALTAARNAGLLGNGGGGGEGYYVYVLEGIGVVAATQATVQTRKACNWAGGGPCPSPGPARVLGTLGGPYPSESAAKADMKTKLNCSNGYWGLFIGDGASKAWLQNNITASDCRTVKQL